MPVDFYEEDCLIDNPFYVDEETECELCERVRAVVIGEERSLTDFYDKYYNLATPVLVTVSHNTVYITHTACK